MIVGLVLGPSIFGENEVTIINHGSTLIFGDETYTRSTLDQPVITPITTPPPSTGATLEDNQNTVGATLS